MLIYIVFYAFVFLFYALLNSVYNRLYVEEFENQIDTYTEKQRTKNKIFVFGSFCVLTLILGLRNSEMGNDLVGYFSSFYRINEMSFIDVLKLEKLANYERGYIVLNKLVGMIYANENFFLFVCAFISLAPVGYIIAKYSKNPLLSLFIYIASTPFVMVFSGLRQAIAIGICFFAFKYIKERKFIRFLIVVWFASLFHSSAYVFFVAYPIYRCRISKNTAIASIFFIPVFYLFRKQVFSFLVKFVKDNAQVDNNGATTLFLVFCAIYVFSVFFGNRDNEEVNGLSNLFYVACLVQAMGNLHNLTMRVGYYFIMFMVLLLPQVIDGIENSSKKEKNVISFVLIIIFTAYGLYALYNGSFAKSNPYFFFWQNYYLW